MSCAARAPLTSVERKPDSSAVICTVPTSSECTSSRLQNGDARSERGEHVEQRGARGVEADAESRIRPELGKSAAAQRKNAAEEMSPGTAASMACSVCGPVMVMESMRARELSHRRRGEPVRCGRGCGRPRERWWCPSVCRPASRMHVFTCALGTGVVKSMAWSGAP